MGADVSVKVAPGESVGTVASVGSGVSAFAAVGVSLAAGAPDSVGVAVKVAVGAGVSVFVAVGASVGVVVGAGVSVLMTTLTSQYSFAPVLSASATQPCRLSSETTLNQWKPSAHLGPFTTWTCSCRGILPISSVPNPGASRMRMFSAPICIAASPGWSRGGGAITQVSISVGVGEADNSALRASVAWGVSAAEAAIS